LTSSGEGQLVVKKLLSTLVVFFLRFPSKWNYSIRHVASCLSKGDVVPLDVLSQVPSLDMITSQMRTDHVITALWFSSMLAEEIGKTDSGNIKQSVLQVERIIPRIADSKVRYKYHEILLLNLDDAVALIRYALGQANAELVEEDKLAKTVNEAIKCFQVIPAIPV